jgi:type I site-specific restriction endonuclease
LIITYDEGPDTNLVSISSGQDLQQVPSNAWFDLIESRTFESEREVEYFFVQPLVEQLGYAEDDCSIGYSLSVYQGVKKTKTEADFVLFDGKGRDTENALVVIEAKRPGKKFTDADVGQARSYAIALSVPYYVLTNGDETRLYRFRAGMQQDALLNTFHRVELRSRWAELSQHLHRTAVLELKRGFASYFANEFPTQG